jgi:predicted enzyme related to lactoylglutathione lyase
VSSRIENVSFDCADTYELSGFWSEVLGYARHPDDHPGDPEAMLLPPNGVGPNVFFQRVPEGKVVKNRLHLCVQPTDRSRDAEVERLTALGATQVTDYRRPDGSGWVVLADPEDNEFCVLRSAEERAG